MTGGKIVLTDDGADDRHAPARLHRSARTRSAPPRRRCGSSSARRLGHGADARARPRRRSSCATCWRSAATARCLLVTDGGSGIRRRRPARSSRPCGADAERRRSTCMLFGNESADAGNYQVGDPGRARARAALRDRHQAPRGGRRRRPRAGGSSAAATKCSSCALPAVVTRQGGHQPAPLPVAARAAAGEEGRIEQATPGVVRRPDSHKQALRVPQSSGGEAEILGAGVEAVPALVELLDSLGCCHDRRSAWSNMTAARPTEASLRALSFSRALAESRASPSWAPLSGRSLSRRSRRSGSRGHRGALDRVGRTRLLCPQERGRQGLLEVSSALEHGRCRRRDRAGQRGHGPRRGARRPRRWRPTV